jgi:hypothetical protein
MWSDVQNGLASVLSSRLFPVLASDPGYRLMLHNAGLYSMHGDGKTEASLYQGNKLLPALERAQSDWGKSIPMRNPGLNLRSSTAALPNAQQSRLETAARMCAQLLLMNVISSGSLREQRAKAVVLEGPTTLYRLWDSKEKNQMRNWWFSQHLWNLAVTHSSAAKQSLRDWLRDRLAISFDFGRCDRVSKLVLGQGIALPAIEAWGLPMPQHGSTNTGPMFQGHKTQYFLPFVPPERVRPVEWPS